jgi:hypothetical protein
LPCSRPAAERRADDLPRHDRLTVIDDPPQSVRNPPGSTIVTWMPSGATSFCSTPEKPSTAHFEVWYGARPGEVMRPSSEEIWMTWPAPCSRRTGSAARVTLMTPHRFVSICARKSSSSKSSIELTFA